MIAVNKPMEAEQLLEALEQSIAADLEERIGHFTLDRVLTDAKLAAGTYLLFPTPENHAMLVAFTRLLRAKVDRMNAETAAV